MATLPPQPPLISAMVDPDRTPANVWQGYLLSLDLIVRGLAGNKIGPLTNAVNDAAAAAAGVQVGGLYRTGSQVNIRIA